MLRTGSVRAFPILGTFPFLAALAACGGAGNASNEAAEATPPAAGDVATLDGTRLAGFTGDAEAGGQLASVRCTPCHDSTFGAQSIGPSLHGIVDRPAATSTRYAYSRGLRSSGIVWTPEKLNQFIERPRRIVPRTRMTFPGVRRPQDRADIIAWLATQ
jgi:cytochrome c